MISNLTIDRKFFYILSFFVVVLLLATFPNRSIHLDDAWLGEQSYWAAKEGKVRSELFRGFENYEDILLVYHKLFIWCGAGVIKVVGWGLYKLKFLSLLFLCIFILFSYYHFRYFKIKNFQYFIFLILSNALIVDYSFVFRPEILLMLLGFISYHFLKKALVDNLYSNYILSGVAAGIAALTHLNGLIFIGAGIITLLIQKKIKTAFIFGVASITSFSFYFIDVISTGRFDLFIRQFKKDPSYREGDFGIVKYLMNVLNEHMRYFHSLTEASLVVIIIVSLFILLKNGYRVFANLQAWYILSSMLFLAIITNTNTSKYLIPIFPFYFLIIIKVFQIERLRFFYKAVFLIVFLSYLCFQFSYSINLIKKASDVQKVNADIINQLALKPGTRILARIEFIFNGIECFDIQGLRYYFVLNEKGIVKMNNDTFFSTARSFERQTIILDSLTYKQFDFQPFKKGNLYDNYLYKGSILNNHIFIDAKKK